MSAYPPALPASGATTLQVLTQAYNNLAGIINQITLNPKPTYDVDGQRVDWAAYLTSLISALAKLRTEIEKEDGPYEELTQLYTSTPYGAQMAQTPYGRGPGTGL